jgi:signal transduction histidine kinase
MTSARWRVRWSLRFNVALLVLGVAMAPLLLVAAWLGMERQFESAMKQNAAFTLEEALLVVDARPLPLATTAPPTSAPVSELERVARQHQARIRLLDPLGRVLEDHDYDWGRDLSERAGSVVLGRGRGREALDERRGNQAELSRALSGETATGCDDVEDTKLVVCYAARRIPGQSPRVLHVQDSAARPLPLLYALRFQLGRLTLVILPFALLLALWVGRRLVGPLEALRDQVLAKVREHRPSADLKAPATSETEQLAAAFNTLLERLEQRRRDNEAFVADLVHEFKNPVAAIRACGEGLLGSDVTPERAERVSRLLYESSVRLDTLVSQFLELARAEAGMREEAWETLDLAALARARVERAERDPRWRGLHFEIAAGAPCLVRGVAERLETVLDNLLANAASFAPAEGHVHVAVQREGWQVVLRVRDDGPGIAPEDAPRVFERFYTTRRHDKGTGLGLALVRAIVEAHGGAVAVESELGHGATFVARLSAAG